MAQPKKLTFKQKQEKKLLEKLESYKRELAHIRKAIVSQPREKVTWQWAALQIHKDLGALEKHPEIDRWRAYALQLAREACDTFTL